MKKPQFPTKMCRVCGREFAWRKKWARHWEEVTVCSDACRQGTPRGGTGVRATEIAASLLQLAAQRGPDKSFCPSEVARALAPGSESAWRALMPQVRAVGSDLVRRGALRCTQGGFPVDPETAVGPIRFGLPEAPPA